jgi:hypothetical protein
MKLSKMHMKEQPAWWYYDEDAHAYYFAPSNRRWPPYHEQREVRAILDIADDGTLAGIELVFDDLPPPPGYIER